MEFLIENMVIPFCAMTLCLISFLLAGVTVYGIMELFTKVWKGFKNIIRTYKRGLEK